MQGDYIRAVFTKAGQTLTFDKTKTLLIALGASYVHSINASLGTGFLRRSQNRYGTVLLTSQW